jgi:hypothetical protein
MDRPVYTQAGTPYNFRQENENGEFDQRDFPCSEVDHPETIYDHMTDPSPQNSRISHEIIGQCLTTDFAKGKSEIGHFAL